MRETIFDNFVIYGCWPATFLIFLVWFLICYKLGYKKTAKELVFWIFLSMTPIGGLIGFGAAMIGCVILICYIFIDFIPELITKHIKSKDEIQSNNS